MKKVLYLATSRKTKGGITSVLKAYEQCPFWKKYNIRWLETHIDRNMIIKMWYTIYSLLIYLVIIWFYDIVHIHCGDFPSIKRKYVFFQIARMLNKKTVVHFHIVTQIDSLNDKRIFKNMVENADAVILLSNEVKDKVMNIYSIDKDKLFVIYNPSIEVSNVQYANDSKTILFAGRLDSNKGYHVLLEAFALIAPKHLNWKIIFAGNGEIDKATKIAEEQQIINQITFNPLCSSSPQKA